MSPGDRVGGARPRWSVRLFAVPAGLGGPDRRRARTLLWVSTALAVAVVPMIVLVPIVLPGDNQTVGLCLVGLVVYAAIRWTVAKSHVVLAGWFFVGYFVLIPLNSLYLHPSDDVSTVDLMFVTVIPLMAALVLPQRHVIVATAIAAIQLVSLAAVTEYVAFTALEFAAYAFILLGIVGSSSIVLSVTIDRAFERADRARVEAQRLADELQVANSELEQRVRSRTTELSEALQREQQLSAALAELSLRDSLTGLHNRRHMDETIEQLFRYAGRSGAPLSVAMIDLDDFKPINDRFTHIVGDLVLQQCAKLMTASIRGADELVRLGGEEFALLMPGTSPAEAVTVCERMRVALESWDWSQIRSGIALTASFGIATTGTASDPTALLTTADEQLIAAKQGGKNQVRCATVDAA